MPTFTTVVDKGPGDTWSASMWNTYVRDNVNGLLSKPFAVVKRTTDLNVSAATDTQVTWDAEDYDTDGMHSTSSNTARLTATTAGLYLVWVYAETYTTSAGGAGAQMLTVYKNGTTTVACRQRVRTTATGTPSGRNYWSLSALVPLAATDYVQLYAWSVLARTPLLYSASRFGAVWVGRYS